MKNRCARTMLLAATTLMIACGVAAPRPAPCAPAMGYGTPVNAAAYGASPTVSAAQNVRAINAALAQNHDVRITRRGVYQIDDHLTIFSHTRLRCGRGVTIQKSAPVCMIRNAHMLAAPPDSDIVIEGGTWDGDYRGPSPGDQYSPTDLSSPLMGVNGEIDAIGVNGFTLRGVTVQHSRTFAVQVSSSSDVTIQDIRLDVAKDGIHINGPGARFHIAHISGYTGDDFIALNAWDWVDSSPTAGDIADVDISDITQLARSPSVSANTNQYGLIKFLPGTRHGQSANIERVHVRGVSGVNSYRAFTFLVDWDPRERVPSGAGVVSGVTIEHVAVKTVHSPLFWLGQDIHDLTVRDLQADPASTGPILYVDDGAKIGSLVLAGVTMRSPMVDPFVIRGSIDDFSLSAARLSGPRDAFLTPRGMGEIGRLQLNDATFDHSLALK